jgi:hypothetical protein
MSAMYLIMTFDASVFPAPLSPGREGGRKRGREGEEGGRKEGRSRERGREDRIIKHCSYESPTQLCTA